MAFVPRPRTLTITGLTRDELDRLLARATVEGSVSSGGRAPNPDYFLHFFEYRRGGDRLVVRPIEWGKGAMPWTSIAIDGDTDAHHLMLTLHPRGKSIMWIAAAPLIWLVLEWMSGARDAFASGVAERLAIIAPLVAVLLPLLFSSVCHYTLRRMALLLRTLLRRENLDEERYLRLVNSRVGIR